MRSPLLITGMHRSGTSLFARFFHHAGIDLGDNLLGASPSNKYGHFEDIEVVAFHRQVLERAFNHSMWVPGPPVPSSQEREQAQTLIAARLNKECWGWKDPRTSLFLDFWHGLLPEAHILITVRDPDQVVDSLARRTHARFYHFRQHNRFLNGWIVYNQACRNFCRRHRDQCSLVLLDRAMEDPNPTIALLSEQLDIVLDPSLFQALYDPAILAHRPSSRRLAMPTLRSRAYRLYAEIKREVDE